MSQDVRYLTLEELLVLVTLLGERAGTDLLVRDLGLLDSAVHRPRSEFAGVQAYPDVERKAAALLHSLVSNHALVDGNKRIAWVACVTFLELNGYEPKMSHGEAVTLVLDVISTDMDVPEIAARLQVAPR